jgi:hypothetical protein
MTIVIPSWRISEVLDLEVFEMARQHRIAEKKEAERAKPPLLR